MTDGNVSFFLSFQVFMSPSSTSNSTDSEVVAHRPPITEDEEAGPSSNHSTNEVFFVVTEDDDVIPVEEDPLKIRSFDEDKDLIRYFVYFVCFQFSSFIKFISILFQSKKKKKPRSQVTQQRLHRFRQSDSSRKQVVTLHSNDAERKTFLPMQLMHKDVQLSGHSQEASGDSYWRTAVQMPRLRQKFHAQL